MAFAQAVGNPLDTIKNFLAGVGPDGEQLGATQKQVDDAKVLSDCEDLYKKARDERRQYEAEWQTNLSFLKGQQWVKWNKQRQMLYIPPTPPWRIRVTINLIQPIVRTMLGKLIAQRSQAKVQPANDSPSAVQDARAQDELLDYLWDVCDSEDESQEALRWAIITGTGLHHPCWDKSIGDELTYPDTDENGQPHPMAGQVVREPNPETGVDDGTGNVVHMGQIDHIAVSPFQFFPEPMATKIKDMEWCFYVSVRPSSYVLRKYGVKIEEETVSQDDFLQFNTQGDDMQLGNETKGVIVKEFWRRPTSEHPEGQYVVYADTQVLANLPNPYPTFPLPFIEVKDSTVPGRFWGRSVVSDLVPLQREFNRLKSQAAEIRQGTARPKWHAFEGALIPGKPITTAPAEVLVTRLVPGAPNGGAPTKIVGGDVPVSFNAEAQALQAQFFEIAGIHDFSRGLQGLGGVRAGYIVQMLLEEDGTRMGVLKGNFDRSVVELEKAKLKLAKQFYTEPRTISVISPDNTTEVKEFYAEKIADDPQVRVIESGALPASWAARQQFILELRQQGLIKDDRVSLELLGLANVKGVYDKINLDIRQAQRENDILSQGNQIPAHDYDNHLVHGQEHDDYRKGEVFEQLAASNPEVANAFVAHMESHKQLMQQAMQGQPVAPKVQLSGKLTPQQEVQAFTQTTGQPASPPNAAIQAPKRIPQVAMPVEPSKLPAGPLDLSKIGA